MVKITAREADRFVRHAPAAEMAAVLIYGPDDGLVRERATQLVDAVLGGERDPFRFTELMASELNADPARLRDEAASLSLAGGRRLVLVRGAGDALADDLAALLDDGACEALVVCEAGNLPAQSRLRKAFERADHAAAVPCYADAARDVARIVEAAVHAAGLKIDGAAVAYLAEWLGADRGLTRQEVEKLVLFKGEGRGPISEEDARACVGDGTGLALEDLVYAAADGESALLDGRLARSFREGNDAVAVLRRTASHLQRLQLTLAALESGASPDEGMGRLRPPVFFQRKAAFTRQIRRWTSAHVTGALDIITEAELQCKSTGFPAEAICGRALMRVAAAARART
ncbi:MAG: DNA polymerase III subunit delta [Proteobacteria bacterium]|nr:DNA polymerase III subunit delta [Pseudomonadota bacterium]